MLEGVYKTNACRKALYVTATTRHIVGTFSDVQPEGRDSFQTQFMPRYQDEGQFKKKILRNMHASLN